MTVASASGVATLAGTVTSGSAPARWPKSLASTAANGCVNGSAMRTTNAQAHAERNILNSSSTLESRAAAVNRFLQDGDERKERETANQTATARVE
jgi:hypothetical protein